MNPTVRLFEMHARMVDDQFALSTDNVGTVTRDLPQHRWSTAGNRVGCTAARRHHHRRVGAGGGRRACPASARRRGPAGASPEQHCGFLAVVIGPAVRGRPTAVRVSGRLCGFVQPRAGARARRVGRPNAELTPRFRPAGTSELDHSGRTGDRSLSPVPALEGVRQQSPRAVDNVGRYGVVTRRSCGTWPSGSVRSYARIARRRHVSTCRRTSPTTDRPLPGALSTRSTTPPGW